MQNYSVPKQYFSSRVSRQFTFHFVVHFEHLCFKLTSLCSPKARTAASIILRGANDFMLDEVERSLHDALCVVKRVMECNQIVAGGGAVEAALSIYLENFATSLVRFTVVVGW